MRIEKYNDIPLLIVHETKPIEAIGKKGRREFYIPGLGIRGRGANRLEALGRCITAVEDTAYKIVHRAGEDRSPEDIYRTSLANAVLRCSKLGYLVVECLEINNN